MSRAIPPEPVVQSVGRPLQMRRSHLLSLQSVYCALQLGIIDAQPASLRPAEAFGRDHAFEQLFLSTSLPATGP
jgi:hypothetical protein